MSEKQSQSLTPVPMDRVPSRFVISYLIRSHSSHSSGHGAHGSCLPA